MSTWATSFSPRGGWILATALLVGAVAPSVAAQAPRLTQAEALRRAFPEATRIERRTAFLSPADLAQARALAGRGVPIDQRVVTYYVGWRDTTPLGVAYFDAHRVRTLPEVLLIVVAPEGVVRLVEVVRFDEPPQYVAPEAWRAQFRGRRLDERLALQRAIRPLTGATLTAEAATRAVRRVLALHAVVRPFRDR